MPLRLAGAGALSGKLGRFPAYLQGWVLFLAFVAGLTSYEFQIAQQLTSIRLILSNSKLGTPPGALGDVSSVSFGVAVPNVSQPKFQQGFFGIMIGFTVFHSAMNFLPAKRINQLAYTSFAWLCAISALIMFALPAARALCQCWLRLRLRAAELMRCLPRLCLRAQITPKRNGADFIFKTWIPATALPPSSSSDSSIPSTAPPSPALSLLAGGTNNGWTAMVGLLMSQYLLLVYDTPSHMAEARAVQPAAAASLRLAWAAI